MNGPHIEELDEQTGRAGDLVAENRTRYPGMTYEQGVYAALLWAAGDSDEKPMEDD